MRVLTVALGGFGGRCAPGATRGLLQCLTIESDLHTLLPRFSVRSLRLGTKSVNLGSTALQNSVVLTTQVASHGTRSSNFSSLPLLPLSLLLPLLFLVHTEYAVFSLISIVLQSEITFTNTSTHLILPIASLSGMPQERMHTTSPHVNIPGPPLQLTARASTFPGRLSNRAGPACQCPIRPHSARA